MRLTLQRVLIDLRSIRLSVFEAAGPAIKSRSLRSFLRDRYPRSVTDSTTATRRSRRTKSGWLNLGVAAAALPVAIAAFRILFYSGGDPVLMKVLVETLDVQTLILGTFLPLLPVLAWAMFQPLISNWSVVETLVGKTKRGRVRGFLLASALTALYLLLGSWPDSGRLIAYLFVGSLLGLAIARGFIVIGQRRAGQSWRKAFRTRVVRGDTFLELPHLLIAPILVLGLVLVAPTNMWLPLEDLTVGNDRLQAYVLQNEGGWMTLLEDGRDIRRVESEVVTERVVCDQGDYESLLLIWTGRTNLNPLACD